MRALQYEEFGGIDVLQWNEVNIPNPSIGQIVINIRAASLNPTDSKIRSGELRFPGPENFPRTMGMDFSGTVLKVGEGVFNFKQGDNVMGYLGASGGAFADFALTDAKNTFQMPENLSFEEATTLPMNAATALKVTTNYLKPKPGKTILINGASGGIGLFAVQYCLLAGAKVSGTASGEESVSILKSLGLYEIIDYKQQNILESDKRWDAILDTSGKLDFEDAKTLLTENGEFSTMVPNTAPGTPGRTDGGKKEFSVFAIPDSEEFSISQKLASEGKIKTFVGKRFPMVEAIKALSQFESGKMNITGKIVLTQ